MLNGNMCVGVYKEWLVTRVGTETASIILTEPYVKPMDITGKTMKGWAMVSPKGIRGDKALERHINLAIDFVKTLPHK